MNARTEFLASLGRNIRQKRKEQKLSQDLLALKSGLHRTYISDVERGNRNISLGSLVHITLALDTTVSEIARGIEGQNHLGL